MLGEANSLQLECVRRSTYWRSFCLTKLPGRSGLVDGWIWLSEWRLPIRRLPAHRRSFRPPRVIIISIVSALSRQSLGITNILAQTIVLINEPSYRLLWHCLLSSL
jgi:hypothetical protein